MLTVSQRLGVVEAVAPSAYCLLPRLKLFKAKCFLSTHAKRISSVTVKIKLTGQQLHPSDAFKVPGKHRWASS